MLAQDLRKRILDNVSRSARHFSFHAVAVSSGVDSNSVLIALLELGYRPTVYSFRMQPGSSSDFTFAKENAARLGCKFVPVDLLAEDVVRDVEWLVRNGSTSKAEIECLWPMLKLMERVDEDALFTGDQADGYFILNRQAALDGIRDAPAWQVDRLRREYWHEDKAFCQDIEDMAEKWFGLDVCIPYRDANILDMFIGTEWKQVNRPRQKQTIRSAFPELGGLKIKTHTPLQLGDGEIAKKMAVPLLESEWNVGGWVSAKGIYNEMARRLR